MLIDRKPLTPLEGTDNEWQQFSPFDGWTEDGRQVTEYQNKRYGSLFKYEYSLLNTSNIFSACA